MIYLFSAKDLNFCKIFTGHQGGGQDEGQAEGGPARQGGHDGPPTASVTVTGNQGLRPVPQ